MIFISLVQLKKVLNSPSLFIEDVSLDEYLSLLGFKSLNNFVFKPSLDVMTLRVLDSLGYELEPRLAGKIQNEVHNNFGKFKIDMLLDYQRELLNLSIKTKNVILALPVGMGKTPIGISYCEHFNNKTLIVCPSSIKNQWSEELLKFTTRNKNEIQIIDGTPQKRKDQWLKESQYKICSYDILKQTKDFNNALTFANSGILVLDEAAYIKSGKSQRNKQIRSIREKVKHVISLTATPLIKDLNDVYQLIDITNPSLLPNKNYFDEMFFIKEKRYFGRREIDYITGTKKWNLDYLNNITKSFMFTKDKKEVLKLPPTSTVNISVDFDKTQKEIEEILISLTKQDFRKSAIVNSGENGLKWLTFGQQNYLDPSIINTDLFVDDIRTERLVSLIKNYNSPSPRLQEVLNLVQSIDDQVILYSSSVRTLNLMEKYLNYEVCKIIGDQKNPEDFLKGNVKTLLISNAGTHGLNLQSVSKMILINQPISHAFLVQLKGRIDRIGQREGIIYYDVQNNESIIENRVRDIVKEKREVTKRLIFEGIIDESRNKKRIN